VITEAHHVGGPDAIASHREIGVGMTTEEEVREGEHVLHHLYVPGVTNLLQKGSVAEEDLAVEPTAQNRMGFIQIMLR